jgi:hypothetical protein
MRGLTPQKVKELDVTDEELQHHRLPDGRNALQIACHVRNEEMVDYLIGIDCHKHDSQSIWGNALQVAIKQSSVELSRKLLSETTPDWVDCESRTALHWAVLSCPAMVGDLLENRWSQITTDKGWCKS